MEDSRVVGSVHTFDGPFTTIKITDSVLEGGPVNVSGASCVNVVDDNGQAYGSACESP